MKKKIIHKIIYAKKKKKKELFFCTLKHKTNLPCSIEELELRSLFQSVKFNLLDVRGVNHFGMRPLFLGFEKPFQGIDSFLPLPTCYSGWHYSNRHFNFLSWGFFLFLSDHKLKSVCRYYSDYFFVMVKIPWRPSNEAQRQRSNFEACVSHLPQGPYEQVACLHEILA